jgi:FlaA1/EpsC-like NDP-sugar epimerase
VSQKQFRSMFRRQGVDALLSAGSLLVAMLVVYEGVIPADIRHNLGWLLAVAVGSSFLGMTWAGSYRKVSDFVGLHDVVGVMRGALLSCVLIVIANLLAAPTWSVPWSLVTIYVLLSTLSLNVSMFTNRLLREGSLHSDRRSDAFSRRRVLIYGAGRAGALAARDIRQSPELGYELVGFVDDDPTKHGKELAGVAVLGGHEILQHYLGPGLREVVLAIPSLEADRRRQLLSHCRQAGAQVRLLPGMAELLRDSGFAHQIRDVRVEDLLPREPIEMDESEVSEVLRDETVMVTGAAGSIGSVLCQQIIKHEPRRLLLVEQGESRLFYLERTLEAQCTRHTQVLPLVADICDKDRLDTLFREYRPSHVFHAAAYKHVPMMERNPQEAIRNNVLATHQLARLADHYKVKCFTLVSTDKAVEPSCVMGASKRAAELILREMQHVSETRFVTVRFGNVLDSDGSVVPLFKQQIAAGGPITITHPDMERFFMTIPEAARLILQATAMSQGGEVFVLEMGTQVKVLDLAQTLVELSGLRLHEDIDIAITGTRPGEKLSEKLFFDHERSVATKSRQIHRARLENGKRLDIERMLRTLHVLLRAHPDPEDLAMHFMSLVRSFDNPAAVVEYAEIVEKAEQKVAAQRPTTKSVQPSLSATP